MTYPLPPHLLLSRWQAGFTLFVAFAAFNLSVGLTFGVIGLLIPLLAGEFGTTQSQLSLALSLLLVVSGITSPVVGHLLDRWPTRSLMIAGCTVGMVSSWLTSMANSGLQFLLAFGVLGGLAFASMGVLPANKLVQQAFPNKVGRVTGLVNIALLSTVAPPFFEHVILTYGWRVLFLLFVAGHGALLMCCACLPQAGTSANAAAGAMPMPTASPRLSPIRTRSFWVVLLSTGLLTATGIVATSYLVAFGRFHGMQPTQSSLLLTVLGGAAIAGAVSYGWLCDRVGPFHALLANGAPQCFAWITLPYTTDFSSMCFPAAVIGLCVGGITPVAIAALGRLFTAAHFGIAFGQMTFASLPLNFVAAPLAGLLYDASNSYTAPFLLQAIFALAAVVTVWLNRAALAGETPAALKPLAP